MPGIGELIDGAVQQAPQPLRHEKASGCIRHYKSDWANSAPTVKVGGTGEPRMESARHDPNLYVASGVCVVVPLADGAARPPIGVLASLPAFFCEVRCTAIRVWLIGALKILREQQGCLRSLTADATVAVA